MVKLRDIYYCSICGNVVEILNEGQPALVCCGEEMELLDPKTEDSTTEKHVPYIEEIASGVLVKVGQNQEHPMLEKHFIKFIEVLTADKVYRAELKPGDLPQAEFPVKKSEIKMAREWCNIHGLWKS
ncbi:MAG: desulfoferrodoxin [Candidatus Cloacimonetes bacterium]|nr:desulfoferrodoxin [Candidatus Cloacimonadota bacterium]